MRLGGARQSNGSRANRRKRNQRSKKLFHDITSSGGSSVIGF
jgi:hypothetical protein